MLIKHCLLFVSLLFCITACNSSTSTLEDLKGIDANQNGLRDTAELKIKKYYSGDLEVQQVMLFGAKWLQQAMIAGATGDQNMSDVVSQEISKLAGCLVEIDVREDKEITFPGNQVSKIKSIVYDTLARVKAYKAYNVSRIGSIQKVEEVAIADCSID